MNSLARYLALIVEPTVEEFKRNPFSLRHAFLACVAAYHAIDRVTYPKSAGNLRKAWGKESMEFLIVDHVAHDFKHVKSEDTRRLTRGIPLSHAIYGGMGFNTHTLNDTGQIVALRHLTFVVQDAVKFLHKKTKCRPIAAARSRST
jgi:hypothetical protein